MTVAVIRDARPPRWLVATLNPMMRVILRTRLGRLIRPFALLEFDGHKSGRRYRIPAGLYEANAQKVVFTPAPWRANFDPIRPVTIYQRGHQMAMVGRLVSDTTAVADTLNRVLAAGASAKLLGLDIPRGHRPNSADMAALNRAMIQLEADLSDG